MKEHCLDIGSIQAFLDGELAHAESARVSGHIAVCDGCAVMLAEAENESALVFPALEREFNSLVPTQRLWTRINDSITVERDSQPIWRKAWAYVSIALANPSLTAAASILLVVGIGAVVWTNQEPVSNDIAVVSRPAASASAAVANAPARPVEPSRTVAATDDDIAPAPRQTLNYQRASYQPTRASVRTTVSPAASAVRPTAEASSYMPGEDIYVKTIANLAKNVDETKDIVMRPAQRIAYERDMAVVNDAISKMQREVKRNPRSESAKQVLYSSYQNKIDLLNSVSQKEELMASIR